LAAMPPSELGHLPTWHRWSSYSCLIAGRHEKCHFGHQKCDNLCHGARPLHASCRGYATKQLSSGLANTLFKHSLVKVRYWMVSNNWLIHSIHCQSLWTLLKPADCSKLLLPITMRTCHMESKLANHICAITAGQSYLANPIWPILSRQS